MFAPKISEFSSVAVQDGNGSRILQNPHLNLIILDHGQKTLQPGYSYLVTIHQIQSTPDLVVDGNCDSEEHL